MAEQPPTIDVAEQLGVAFGFHQRGQLSQAQAIYENLLRINPAHADALHLLGLVAFQQRQFDRALELIGRAIAVSPTNAAFYANRAIVHHELKQLDEAIGDYSTAIALKPDHIDAYANRGVARRALKQLDAAVADYTMAISLKPDHVGAYNNRGNALRELKRLDAAIADFGKAIALKPDYAEAYNNRGNALQELNKLDAAIADYTKAIALKPDYADAYNNRGAALRDLKQLDAAMADCHKAIALRPDYAEAYYNRGVTLAELNNFAAAVADFDRAIALKPDLAGAYNNRGLARQQLKQLDAALADHDKAIALKPDFAEAYNNRALALGNLKQLDAALADYEKAIAIRPDYAHAYHNRGVALHEMKRIDAAIADYDKAIALRPAYAGTYWNKALSFLLAGDLETGFDLYEWRWKHPDLHMAPRRFAQPLWLGQAPLRDKRILLYGEQGFGDTIQFCRYASLAAAAGAEVILQVPQALVGLLKSLEGVSQVVADGEALPDFDYHCPLLSLPLAFKTVLGTIPDPTPYLHADPAKARDWQTRIGERRKLKIGVVWSGGFRPNQPEVWSVDERRNIRLDIFARALREVDADFFSLQKGDPAESEIRGREIEYWPRGNFHNFMGEIKDFADTAALVANLDLVVTVDTATAHLAAALGKPTWILNRFDTCWRWLLDRDDSPWYRSVTLYRQDDSRRWEPVLERAAADLTKLVNEPRAGVTM